VRANLLRGWRSILNLTAGNIDHELGKLGGIAGTFSEGHDRPSPFTARMRSRAIHPASEACLYRKSDSAIIVMKSAEDGRRYDAAHVLNCAIDRSVLVERPMSPQLIIIGGILRQNSAQVRFAQDNYMVDALASDRSDQSFDCQGEPGAMGLSRMPMARNRCVT
jgi:hypothetical protein